MRQRRSAHPAILINAKPKLWGPSGPGISGRTVPNHPLLQITVSSCRCKRAMRAWADKSTANMFLCNNMELFFKKKLENLNLRGGETPTLSQLWALQTSRSSERQLMFQCLVLQVIYSSVFLSQQLLGNTVVIWHGVVAHASFNSQWHTRSIHSHLHNQANES